jgi:hypothetical protein
MSILSLQDVIITYYTDIYTKISAQNYIFTPLKSIKAITLLMDSRKFSIFLI